MNDSTQVFMDNDDLPASYGPNGQYGMHDEDVERGEESKSGAFH
jgi:hypothetical protein